MTPAEVVVLGGSGFVGRHVVAKLVDRGHRVRIPTRRREEAKHLILLPTARVVDADVHDPAVLVPLLRGAAAVVNLIGILNEVGRETFARAHVDLARTVVTACKSAGVSRLLHMSALNANPEGPSRYLRSKGEAEAIVATSGLDWTIFRPSVIFGREDAFLNLFARLSRIFPVIPLGGADARFQPVYVGDVAHCFAHAVDDPRTFDQRYSLCGPRVYTLRELVRYVGELSGAPRPIVPLPGVLAQVQALLLELLPGKLMSRDNLASMREDNVCEGPFPAAFAVQPRALETVAPEYLAPAARKSHYDRYRATSGR
ncbi:MAG: complex I NDUFA9 subunit family protein [Casimicrobiaceae bacterium]